MTATVEAAVQEYVKRRTYWERNRTQDHPMRGFIKYEQARFALGDAIGVEFISYEQADLIADTYLAEIDPPVRTRSARLKVVGA